MTYFKLIYESTTKYGTSNFLLQGRFNIISYECILVFELDYILLH